MAALAPASDFLFLLHLLCFDLTGPSRALSFQRHPRRRPPTGELPDRPELRAVGERAERLLVAGLAPATAEDAMRLAVAYDRQMLRVGLSCALGWAVLIFRSGNEAGWCYAQPSH